MNPSSSIKSPIHITHNKWHVRMSTLLHLQYVSPTASDMYAQAHYYVSSTCHLQLVTCTHEHTTKSPVCVTHSEWHARTSTLLHLQYVSPTSSDMYAQAHYYVSNTCHPQWVTHTHKHVTMTLVYATHGEWHICKSIPPCLQCVPPTMSGMYAIAQRPKPRTDNSLVDHPKG